LSSTIRHFPPSIEHFPSLALLSLLNPFFPFSLSGKAKNLTTVGEVMDWPFIGPKFLTAAFPNTCGISHWSQVQKIKSFTGLLCATMFATIHGHKKALSSMQNFHSSQHRKAHFFTIIWMKPNGWKMHPITYKRRFISRRNGICGFGEIHDYVHSLQ